ncbi:hypothetical protein U0070_011409 [Myodes glareolus]|uniref:Uncharacterized protein n=1 Tax=Myodes glareolus TaxID=447135 RepID=A0AAW0HY42_MYOGA
MYANRPPAKLNLLTCQVKTNPEEKKCFDLISRKALSQTVQCLLYTFLESQPFEELVFGWTSCIELQGGVGTAPPTAVTFSMTGRVE